MNITEDYSLISIGEQIYYALVNSYYEEIKNDIQMKEDATAAVSRVLWDRWQELLPNSPRWMAERFIDDLANSGWYLVKIDSEDK